MHEGRSYQECNIVGHTGSKNKAHPKKCAFPKQKTSIQTKIYLSNTIYTYPKENTLRYKESKRKRYVYSSPAVRFTSSHDAPSNMQMANKQPSILVKEA